MLKKLALVYLIMTLAACTRINRENFEQLEIGMSVPQVEELLGDPDQCDKMLGAETCTWGEREGRHITVLFMASKAVSFSYQDQ